MRTVTALFVAVVASAAWPSSGFAADVTLDFDPPDFASGDTVSLVGDIGFVPAAKVFTPAHVTTFSGSQALRVAGVCASPDCPNGAYRLQIRFGQPLPAPVGAWLWRRAERVAMRFGADSVNTPCFAEGTACTIYARLFGFDEHGTRVAVSPDVFLLDSLSGLPGLLTSPITRQIEVRDPSARIVRVELVYGKDTSHDLIPPLPGEPQIDHLEVTFPDSLPDGAPPPAPTVQISEPTDGSQRAYPFQTRLRGSVSVPGGLAAFCYRLNPTAGNVSESDCRNDADLRPDSTFDIPIADGALNAGLNVLSVTVYDLWGQSATGTARFTAQAPPPPRVTIAAPRDAQWLSAGQATYLSGSVATVGALQGFCIIVDPVAVPAPGTCLTDVAAVQSANVNAQPLLFGTLLAPQRFSPGKHELSVFAVDRWGQIGRADVTVNLPTNFRVVGMEISQGIQTEEIPLNFNGSAAYTGVKLRQGVPTVVRVFAGTTYPGSYSGASMLLAGFVPDPRLQERQLGTLLPDSTPATLTNGALSVPLAMRANPNGGFVFTLPSGWTVSNSLRLKATLRIPFTLHECAACAGDNDFSVTGVDFAPPRQIVISPMALIYTDAAGVTMTPPAPAAVFSEATNLAPVPATSVTIYPYVATIDVSDLVDPATGSCRGFTATCEAAVFNRVAGFEVYDHPGVTIGVGPIGVGWESPMLIQHPFHPAVEPIAIADTRLPFTRSAHELYHEFNYWHAGPNCPQSNNWIWWPPDDKGYIHGVGLDRRKLPDASGTWNGQYRILMPGTQGMPGGQANYYDLMSYCAGETTAWISVENWNKFDDAFPNGLFPTSIITSGGTINPPGSGSRPDAVEVDGGTLLASAVVDESGRTTFLHVARTGNWMPKAADIGTSNFVFVVRDAGGAVLARIPPLVARIHGHGPSGAFIAAALPAKAAASVALEYRERTIGVVRRSAGIPRITLKAPRARASLARDESLRVEWAASDADGKAVEIRVEYSPGADKPFRPVYSGPNRGGATIPGSMFEAAGNARLRIVASDGFNERAVTTGPIIVEPASPRLTVLAPPDRISFPRSTPVRFEAAAFGNDRLPLPKKQLTWFIDNRPAGNGRVLERRGLKPGRHIARIVARDGELTSTRRVTFTIRRSPTANRR